MPASQDHGQDAPRTDRVARGKVYVVDSSSPLALTKQLYDLLALTAEPLTSERSVVAILVVY